MEPSENRAINELQELSNDVESKIKNALADLSRTMEDFSSKVKDEIFNADKNLNDSIQSIIDSREEQKGEDWRLQTIKDFSNWLFEFTDDAAPSERTSDEGLQVPDLFTVFSHFISLKHEVREQTKAVQSANQKALENMASAQGALLDQERNLRDTLIHIRSLITDARKDGEEKVILEVIKIRDMLAESIAYEEEKAKKQNRLFAMRSKNRFLENQVKLLAKIDDIFRRLYVFSYTEKGDLFNPKTMRAISTSVNHEQEDGTVLKVLQQGYRKEDKILQIAEVEICKEE